MGQPAALVELVDDIAAATAALDALDKEASTNNCRSRSPTTGRYRSAGQLFVVPPAFPICAAGTGVDGPWNMPLNSSLNVARGCARKSIWLP